MKLGTKVNLVLVTVTTFILAIVFWVIVDMVSVNLRQQVLEDSQGVINILGDQIERTFIQNYIQQDTLQTTIDKIGAGSELKYINVNDARGYYVAAKDHELIGKEISFEDREILKKIEVERVGISAEKDRGTFYEFERHVPVFFKGDDTSSEMVNVIDISVSSRSKNLSDIEEAKKVLQVVTRFVDQNMRSLIVTRKISVDVLQRIVNSVKDFYFFNNFIIFDEKLNIIASTQNNPNETKDDPPEYKKARLGVMSGELKAPFEIDRTYITPNGKTVDVIVRLNPVFFVGTDGKKQIAGLTEIQVFKDVYKVRVNQLKLRMLWIGLVFTVILVVVLAVILETEVVGPIRKYSLVAKKIAGGDFNQTVEHTSNDEIGQFGDVFNSMVGSLREFDKLKSDFISVAAHQLRTPLSGVKWVLKLLLDGDLGEVSETQKGMLRRGYETNEKMIQLVNDLLNVSRIENSKFGYDFGKNDFMRLLSMLMESTVLPSKERNIEVRLENHAGTIPDFVFDPEKLLIALQNIVDNAMKYTFPRGRVTISVSKHGDYIEIKISDTGVGIPKTDLPKLFSKFFRAANVIHLQTDGSGLGLFIVKSIVVRHGGQIWVDTVEGKGTAFTVLIPTITELIPKEDVSNNGESVNIVGAGSGHNDVSLANKTIS
ncbi:MAG: HAMP domain-containing sensor histidine kinase [bacterium]|nr:HAMP domain-containing sensor histidine kinase [bacterium]